MRGDWAEKYRPKRLDEVVGNPAAINDLREWAESWDRGSPKKNAAVLMGDPGVGKTSCALALANEYGWGVVELNASDLRNADAIKKVATSGALNETFTDSGEFVSTRSGGRKLIILDEADNIFGKEDVGGVQAIVNTIRETHQPIILIVNDFYALSKKAPVIKNLCLSIRFSRIQKVSIIKLLRNICQNEDIAIPQEALSALAEHSGGDLRSAINDLESLCLGRKKITEKDVTILGYRDSSVNIFKALSGIFRSTGYAKARESVMNLDEDPEHLLLWIDENLPLEVKKPQELAHSYEPLSKASIFLGRVRKRQHYRLWGYAMDLMTAGVALAKTSRAGGYTRYQFPSWLTKMSRTRGMRNIQRSVNEKLASYCHTSKYVAQVDIFPYYAFLFANSQDFNRSQIRYHEFDADEIGFILGEPSDSPLVRKLVEESLSIKSSKREQEAKEMETPAASDNDIEDEEEDLQNSEGQKDQEPRQRNLSEF